MDKKMKNDRLINRENEMIGKFLSMEVNKENRDNACPSDEQLAAFLDGNLNDAEKDAIMGHVSSCDDCYDLFTESINIQAVQEELEEQVEQEEQEEQEETAKGSWLTSKLIIFKFIPYSLAMAAAVLMMFYVFRDSSVERLSFVRGRVAMLASDIGSDSFLYAGGQSAASDYGFTDAPTPESISFRIGMYLADIEMATMAGNKQSTSALLHNIIALLKSMKVSDSSLLLYEDMKREVEGGGSLSKVAGRIDKAIISEIDELLYIRFGQWCEGGRIAAVTGAGRFYRIDDISIFIKILEKENLPEGVIKTLREIEKVVKEEVSTEKQFSRLEKEYENLILMH